jgi:hypothetical protein
MPPNMANLSPIKGSPTSSIPKCTNDVITFDTIAGNTAHNANNSRKALAVLGARRVSVLRDNLTREELSPATKDNLPPPPQKERHKKGRVLMDLTGLTNGQKSDGKKKEKAVDFEVREQMEEKKEKDRVKGRVKEWEREKERLREIERLEELRRERDEESEKAKEEETGGLSQHQKDMLSKVPPSITLSSSGECIGLEGHISSSGFARPHFAIWPVSQQFHSDYESIYW